MQVISQNNCTEIQDRTKININIFRSSFFPFAIRLETVCAKHKYSEIIKENANFFFKPKNRNKIVFL